MKNITKEFINKIEGEYLNNDVYTIARHALTNNSISSIAKVNEQTETFQSSNTREIDELLNRYVRKFSYEIKNINDANEIYNKKSETMKNIYKILCSSFGVPPKKFSFEYVSEDKEGNKNYNIIKDITPYEFLEKYIGIELYDYVSIIHSPTEDKPFNETYTVKYLGNVVEGNSVKYLNLEMNRLKELIINQLKEGEPVWFGSDCSQAADRKAGVWDDLSFDIDRLFQINTFMPKEAMLDTWESAMNHAMVITGVNIEDEKPTKWKIENSWGDDVANKGYYVATDSWFDKFVYQAVINKKYLSEQELNDLNKEPKKLELWDPMGTLA